VTSSEVPVSTPVTAKMEALRLILAEVDAEDAKISQLIEDLRTQGLLV